MPSVESMRDGAQWDGAEFRLRRPWGGKVGNLVSQDPLDTGGRNPTPQ